MTTVAGTKTTVYVQQEVKHTSLLEGGSKQVLSSQRHEYVRSKLNPLARECK